MYLKGQGWPYPIVHHLFMYLFWKMPSICLISPIIFCQLIIEIHQKLNDIRSRAPGALVPIRGGGKEDGADGGGGLGSGSGN